MCILLKQVGIVAIVVGPFCTASLAEEPIDELLTPMRSWTDSTNSQSAEAALVSLLSGYGELIRVDGKPEIAQVPARIRMKKKSGEYVTIPLSRLSSDDQMYVKKAVDSRRVRLMKKGGSMKSGTPVTLLVRVVRDLAGTGLEYEIVGQKDAGLKKVKIDYPWPKEMRKQRSNMLIEVHGDVTIRDSGVTATAGFVTDTGQSVTKVIRFQDVSLENIRVFRELGEVKIANKR